MRLRTVILFILGVSLDAPIVRSLPTTDFLSHTDDVDHARDSTDEAECAMPTHSASAVGCPNWHPDFLRRVESGELLGLSPAEIMKMAGVEYTEETQLPVSDSWPNGPLMYLGRDGTTWIEIPVFGRKPNIQEIREHMAANLPSEGLEDKVKEACTFLRLAYDR